MSKLEEAARKALEIWDWGMLSTFDAAMHELRAALAEPEEPDWLQPESPPVLQTGYMGLPAEHRKSLEASRRPWNCGSGHCSCVECPFDECRTAAHRAFRLRSGATDQQLTSADDPDFWFARAVEREATAPLLARIEQDEALMQQVLEALRSATYTSPEAGQRGGEAVTALRARLEKKA